MANEGSTKPTYSELIKCSCDPMNPTEPCDWCLGMAARRTLPLLEAENLRVRGLLQRGVGIVEQQACSYPICRDAGHVKVKEWLVKAKQGAESADIGKLETADKSGEVPIGICQECHEEIGYWCMHQAWRDESGKQMFRHSINCTAPIENGSAESGVEMGKVNRVEEIWKACRAAAQEVLWSNISPEELDRAHVQEDITYQATVILKHIQPLTDKCFRPENILAASPELLPTQLPKENK